MDRRTLLQLGCARSLNREVKECYEKGILKYCLAFAVLLSLCAPPCGHSQTVPAARHPNTVIPFDKISSVIRDQFGSKLKVSNDTTRYYLQGDFNGDGFADIAVQVNVGESGEELKNHKVKYIDIDPYNGSNGMERDPVSNMWNNCLGIAVLHGTSAGWDTPAAKYIFYDCFSNFRIIRKGQKIYRGAGSRGPTPTPKGDSIQLELENGATALVYWNGKTYRGFGQRGGD